MRRPEELHDITDHVLYGLTADESLKSRILQKAAGNTEVSRKSFIHPVPVLCSILLLLLVCAAAVNGIRPVNPSESAGMNVFAAGIRETVPNSGENEMAFMKGLNPDRVISVEISSSGTVSDREQCASLIRLLIDNAQPSDPENLSAKAALIIRSEDGSVIGFAADDPYLIGESVWRCTSFFSLFQQIVNQ